MALSVSRVGADPLIGHSVARLKNDSLIFLLFFFPCKNLVSNAKEKTC